MGKENTVREELDMALRTHEYAKVEAILDALSEPLGGETAAHLLNTALDCIPYIFEKVLSHCGHGEIIAEREIVIDGENGFVRGSLPLLAAAMGKYEHLRIMLDAGMDANGAVEQSVQCLPVWGELELCVDPMGEGDAWECSVLAVGRRDFTPYRWSLGHCTPLAAAILCGQLECVKLLLRRPDVAVAESEAVSSALLFSGRRSPRAIEAQSLVLSALEDRPIRFAGAVWQLSARRLGQELRRAHYDAAYLGEAAERALRMGRQFFIPKMTARVARLLQMLFDRAPELLDDPSHRGRLLSFLPRIAPTHPLFERYLAHCGGTADVGQLMSPLPYWPEDYWTFLAALSERVECVLDRDACLPPFSQRELRKLERYVRFLPPRCSGGLSCLTQRVLDTGSASFTRWAAQKGWLCEPRRLMLQYLSERRLDSLRATVLLLPETEADETLAPEKWYEGSRRWFPADERRGGFDLTIGG